MELNVKIGLSEYKVTVLFVVNNYDEETSNYSILGVFDTPTRARNAVESQKEKIEASGHKVPHMSMKCVVLNAGAYQGFRTWPTDMHGTKGASLVENMNIKYAVQSLNELEERLNEKYKL